MDYKKEIARAIIGMSGRCSPYEVFCDWVTASAIAIQNGCRLFQTPLWKEREERYIQMMAKYQPKERELFGDMLGMLALELEKEPSDVLGSVYMEAGLGNKNTGQFFTPFHISEMCARLSLSGRDTEKPLVINEPSCGGGGMIIAAAKALKERGINYQRRMEVVAQDLDWKAVYMCYVQLSLLGIRAVVVQGSTLEEPYIPGNTERKNIFVTPAKMGIWG